MSGCINIEATAAGFGKTWKLVCFNKKDFMVVPQNDMQMDTHKLNVPQNDGQIYTQKLNVGLRHNDGQVDTEKLMISMLKAVDDVLADESHKGALVATRAEIRQYAQPVFGFWFSQWFPEKSNQPSRLVVENEFHASHLFYWLFTK